MRTFTIDITPNKGRYIAVLRDKQQTPLAVGYGDCIKDAIVIAVNRWSDEVEITGEQSNAYTDNRTEEVAVPDRPVPGMVDETASVYPKRGEYFYVCNPMDEIIEACDSGEPFVAHMVIAMKPKRVIIEPGTIARIEEI